MKNTLNLITLFLAAIALALVLFARIVQPDPSVNVVVPPSDTDAPQATQIEETQPVETPTPTPEPTAEPEYFTISAIGDCTLASHQFTTDFDKKVDGDYSYPFSNTVSYFENDDFTIANLECTFSDRKLTASASAQFYFRSPAAYANILVEGGVDFVTTANNHSMDFFEAGIKDTSAALEAVNMPYGVEDQAQIVTTESGLKIGVYCAFNDFLPSKTKSVAAIEQLKKDGAEYIICAFHWGKELQYRPLASQEELAHACIDAGANLIYGSHPHCLQPIEEYNGGIVLYSMGNWSFGGNTNPSDWNTALVQITVKRDTDGTISNGKYTIVPCSVSESRDSNDYKPTPYEEGTEEYELALSKITGTYEGPDGNANYSNWYSSYGG